MSMLTITIDDERARKLIRALSSIDGQRMAADEFDVFSDFFNDLCVGVFKQRPPLQTEVAYCTSEARRPVMVAAH